MLRMTSEMTGAAGAAGGPGALSQQRLSVPLCVAVRTEHWPFHCSMVTRSGPPPKAVFIRRSADPHPLPCWAPGLSK
jgi:hypothetical protein